MVMRHARRLFVCLFVLWRPCMRRKERAVRAAGVQGWDRNSIKLRCDISLYRMGLLMHVLPLM